MQFSNIDEQLRRDQREIDETIEQTYARCRRLVRCGQDNKALAELARAVVAATELEGLLWTVSRVKSRHYPNSPSEVMAHHCQQVWPTTSKQDLDLIFVQATAFVQAAAERLRKNLDPLDAFGILYSPEFAKDAHGLTVEIFGNGALDKFARIERAVRARYAVGLRRFDLVPPEFSEHVKFDHSRGWVGWMSPNDCENLGLDGILAREHSEEELRRLLSYRGAKIKGGSPDALLGFGVVGVEACLTSELRCKIFEAAESFHSKLNIWGEPVHDSENWPPEYWHFLDPIAAFKAPLLPRYGQGLASEMLQYQAMACALGIQPSEG